MEFKHSTSKSYQTKSAYKHPRVCKQDPDFHEIPVAAADQQTVCGSKLERHLDSAPATRADLDRAHHDTMKQLSKMLETLGKENRSLRSEIAWLKVGMMKLQDDYSDQLGIAEDLKNTTYNGEHMWKVSSLHRKIKATQEGKLISLYSVPFFTSQRGYRMRLQLYLDGVGSGKSTHISLYMFIMRGDFDDLLSWPFRKEVTMALLSQDKKVEMISRTLSPGDSNSCFQKPTTDLNPRAGFSKFAPISVLKNCAYSKNDAIYIKVIVEKSGLVQ